MADVKAQYEQCLSAKGDSTQCKKFETELRKLEQSEGQNFCVAETANLMKCTTSGHACSGEFFAMRECNRARGPMFTRSEEGNYGIVKGFQSEVNKSTAMSAPPSAALQSLLDSADDFARKLNIDGAQGIRI